MNRTKQYLSLVAVLSAVFSVFLMPVSPVCAASTSVSGVERSYPGTILASRSAQLAFRISGPLTQVNVEPGMTVKKGQLLMQVDPRDFTDNIAVLEARLEEAKARKILAERNYERARTLFDQQVSAGADFDQAKGAFDAAFAGVRGLEAQLQIARHRLKDSSLRAPFAGVVTKQKVENFEMVQAGQVVVAVQDMSSLEVEIRLPEAELLGQPLKKGATGLFELSALPGRQIKARLKEWSPAADPVTRTYALRFAFSVPDDLQVFPGMTADVFYNGSQTDLVRSERN